MTLDHPGPTIARIRRSQGLTQPQLAERLGMSTSTLRKMEQGDALVGHGGRMIAWLVEVLEA